MLGTQKNSNKQEEHYGFYFSKDLTPAVSVIWTHIIHLL